MSTEPLRQVAIIANPFSGSRKNPRRVAELSEEITRAGLEPVVMWGRDELQDSAAAPGFSERFRCVVVAGGDGTLHRVVNTLRNSSPAQTPLPIAHYALGTENLFAAEFGHSRDAAAFARMIAAGKTAAIDLGQVKSGLGLTACDLRGASEPQPASPRPQARFFSIVASLGFDAEVVHRLHRWRCRHPEKLRRVRRTSYLRPILGGVLGYTFPVMEIEADGRKFRSVMCMVFNLPRYGLGFKICPHAQRDDGMLDYAFCESAGKIPLIRYALAAKAGRLDELKDVKIGRARKLRITCPTGEPVPMELDGDEAGFTPVEIEAIPAALAVVVP